MPRCITDTNAAHDPAQGFDPAEDTTLPRATERAIAAARTALEALRDTLPTHRGAIAWRQVTDLIDALPMIAVDALDDERAAVRLAAHEISHE